MERTNSGIGGLKVDTYDLDFRNDLDFGDAGLFQWGVGWRQITGREAGDVMLTSVRKRETDLYHGFAQYEVGLFDDLLSLTVGSKYEHNDYTGSEFQPNLRLALDTGEGTLWTAVSRTVRTPTRFETDVDVLLGVDTCALACAPLPPFSLVAIHGVGSESLDSEELVSLEAGYKHHFGEKVYAEVAAFYNEFKDIIEIDQAGATTGIGFVPFLHYQTDVPMNNIIDSNIWGGEANIEWQALDWWKLGGNYSYAKIRIKEAGLTGFTSGEGSAPRHQVKFISNADLLKNLSLDVMLYYIDEIKDQPSVSSRYDLDIRLAWRPNGNMEISLIGQNLFYNEKNQMEQFLFLGTATKRNGYLQVKWEF
ncbi:MAG: TonB-dependent receptor [Deltaproteobacteria bacterium]|nr:TonB-dependent receptor [Deltaproteobacteria bacterium]